MHHARPNRIRRALVWAALATLLGVVSLTLSQCTQVADNLTGVGLTHGRASHCVRDCHRAFRELLAQERKLHRQNEELCNEDAACEAAEEARHRAAIEDLMQAERACRAHCHRQGGGDGDDDGD